MIILTKQLPLLVLEREVIKDMERHRLSDTTHGMLLLPIIRNCTLIPNEFRIAMEYRNAELTPLFMELIPGNILKDLSDLPQGTRIPYMLFLCSDAFHHHHREQLQYGHTAYALIRELTTVRE